MLAGVGVVLVVVLGLVAVGRETGRLARAARPAVFDMEEAVDYIADRLPPAVAGRLTHDDVRWVLRADADLLESATEDPAGDGPDRRLEVVDEDAAVARILAASDDAGRDLADEDVAAVLDARMAYLDAIGAVGPQVAEPDDRPS